jgi:hypothetical protein
MNKGIRGDALVEEKLTQFNQLKKKSEKQVGTGLGIMAIAAILFLIIAGAGTPETGQLVGIIVGLVGGILALVGVGTFAKIKRSFKTEVLCAFFSEFIPGTDYIPDRGLSPTEVYATEFLKRADRFHSEDLLRGKLDDVDFLSSDVRLEERHVQHTKNGTRVYYVPYFVGRVFRFTFNKEFEGYLQVLESGSPLSGRKYTKVEMESVDFNKKFKTFATTELSAFYVLTPDIMEAIFELEKRNPGRIGLSFTGENLYIAINNNKDTFEIKMFRNIDNAMMEGFKNDLMVIKDFVHTLKLNTKIFKNYMGGLK